MNRLHELMQKAVQRELANVHTALIAKVTNVNREEGTINCHPVVSRIVNGKAVSLPEFPQVPVINLQGGGAYIALPIRKGDYCLLIISERCFDNWYEGYDDMPPASIRMFDYSDAFAIVGVNPKKNNIKIPDENNILITTEKGDHIRLVDEDRIDIETKGNFNINVKGDLTTFVEGNHTSTIKGDMTTFVEGNQNSTVKGDMTTFVEGNQNSTVKGDITANVDGFASLKATKIMLDGGGGANGNVVTTQCMCPVTGAPHIMGSNTVTASK